MCFCLDLRKLRHDGTSLIPNADFETGTSGWTVVVQSTGGNIATTTSTFTEGMSSAVLSSEITVRSTITAPAG